MTKPNTNAFGKYLRDHRVAAGMTLRSTAKALGMTAVYLGEIERGTRNPLHKKWWSKLGTVIPGVTHDGLERDARRSASLMVAIGDMEPAYQDIALEFYRRVKEQDFSTEEMRGLRAILLGRKHNEQGTDSHRPGQEAQP